MQMKVREFNMNFSIVFFRHWQLKAKSNLHYTRGITSKRVTSGGAHLRGLVPGQHCSEETSLATLYLI